MLEKLSKIVGIVSALVSLGVLAFSSYGAVRHNITLTIDKDVVTAPPRLLDLGRWVQHYGPPLSKLVGTSKPACQVPKDLQEGLSRVPSIQEFDLYSRSDFGSVTVGIANNRTDNVKDGEATLRISGLQSFQGVTGNSNFMAMDKKLAEWNGDSLTDSPLQQDINNKILLLSLPELKTGGFIRITVYGQNSGRADADIIGLSAPAEKQYIVKAQSTTSLPKWMIVLGLFFLGVSLLLLANVRALVPKSAPSSRGFDGSPEIHILSPVENAKAPHLMYIEGRVFPPDARVWVIVHPVSDDHFWVQPRVTQKPDGTWTAEAYIGRTGNADIGHRYEVMAVAEPAKNLAEGMTLAAWPTAKARSEIVTVERS